MTHCQVKVDCQFDAALSQGSQQARAEWQIVKVVTEWEGNAVNHNQFHLQQEKKKKQN